MASVSRPRDRGQLILVTGLTIAVILLMLVLLLNTVIYTENLATRGIDSGGGDAVEYRATVVGSVGELVERENERYDGGHPPEVGVEAGIEEIDRTLSERYLERATVAEVRSYEIDIDEESLRIWQNASNGSLADENSEWTVATDVTSIDRYEITIDDIDDPFHIIMYGSGGEVIWEMEISDVSESEQEPEFEVTIDGDSEASQTYETDSLEIDLIEGEIDGESEVIDPPTDPSSIDYENGDATIGTFDLHLNGEPGEQVTPYDEESGEAPYYTYTVGNIDLTLYYETSELRFISEETITAGEEEGGS